MKPLYISIIVAVVFAMSCGSSKSSATTEEIAALETLIKNRDFKIESNWAYPLSSMAMQQVLNSGLLPPGNTSSAISLIGNSNFLSISGDSITSYLPYYGERQMQVDYGGGDSAIQFDGLLEDYNAIKNKNDSYTISFQSKSKSEHFNGNIIIFPSLRTEIMLNSASRFSIRYSGVVIEEEE
tara:strand:+ start:105 stop:650 length:546 start_codon:yes stop_codon:yes gene_type:complete